jgi:hypothetical protein
MRATTFLTALGIASLGFWGCSQSTGPTASATGGDGSLGAALVGTWTADTSVSVKADSFLSVPVSVSASVLFHPDSSFTSYLDGDSVLGAGLQGHLFTETGTWSSHGSDTVVVHPDSCMAPDTATTMLGFLSVSLPFHSQGSVYAVNAPIPTACPDSLVITTRPVHDTLRLQLPVTVPIQGQTIWHLTFLKQ